MDERQLRTSPWIWVGSILIALLVVGSVGFGAYRLYALGWARGAASSGEAVPVEPSQAPPILAPGDRGYRAGGLPILGLLLLLLVVGAVFRHTMWRRHGLWARRFYGSGPWHGHPPYPGYPGCEPGQPQGAAPEREAGRAA